MPSATILSLPNPLILLIHLHILEYPHANKPEYDHAMFTTSRGLRDRMKTVEDVAYFLVGKLEGGSVRTILSTYPCVSPSDSVAFRTSLSKYLEALRHSSVYPSSGSNPKSTSTAKSKPTRAAPAESKTPVAWWWKDVMVRKSLLEECCGEKFERVVLSLSTHTLLKALKKPQVVNSQDDIINLLCTQPQFYTDLVSRTQAARHAWARSVAALLRRGEDLKMLRARLLQTESLQPSKYDSIPTNRLISLSQSKFTNLLQGPWAGERGREALEFLIDVAGVKPTSTLGVGKPKVISKPNLHAQSQPQPLPIAAAHHPSYIKKLKKPIFSTPSITNRKSVAPAQAPTQTKYSGLKLAFADTLENEKRVYSSLSDALAKARKSVIRVRERVSVLEARAEVKGRGRGTVLWVPPERKGFEYQTEPTPSILSRLGLKVPDVKGGIGRIDVIRAGLISWPPVLDLLSLAQSVDVEGEGEEGGTRTSKIPMRGSLPRPKAFRGKVKSDDAVPPPSSGTPKDVGAIRNGVGDGKRKDKKENKKYLKTSPRKSIRFSIAAVRRKSMFAEDFEVDEEISRIISTAEDTSTETDPLVQATPQRRINRIYTAGTPRGNARKLNVRGERMSYVMPTDDPGPLPRLVSGGSEFWDVEEGGVGMEEEGEGEEEGEEGGYEEAPSVTIRDILLQSESGFDLLEEDGVGEESFDSQWD